MKIDDYIMKPVTPATKYLQPNYMRGTLRKYQVNCLDSPISISHWKQKQLKHHNTGMVYFVSSVHSLSQHKHSGPVT